MTIGILVPVRVDDRFVVGDCRGDRGRSVRFRLYPVRVSQMVDDDIRQDTDPVFFRFAAELYQIRLRSQRRIITNQKSERLIKGPPVGAPALWLLHRHGQHIFEAGISNVFQIDQNIMISPVKCVKRQSVFRIFGKHICIVVFKIIGSRDPVTAPYEAKAQ